jgi:hypothetical protein
MGFSLKVTNNITRFHNHRNNESTRPNLLNTDRQRPKYIDDAKLNNRNKHSVSYITIRHAIRHNTVTTDQPVLICWTQTDNVQIHRRRKTQQSQQTFCIVHNDQTCDSTHHILSHDSVSRPFVSRPFCLTTPSHDHHPHDVYNSSIVNYKSTILHRVDLHHRQQPVIHQRTSSRCISWVTIVTHDQNF